MKKGSSPWWGIGASPPPKSVHAEEWKSSIATCIRNFLNWHLVESDPLEINIAHYIDGKKLTNYKHHNYRILAVYHHEHHTLSTTFGSHREIKALLTAAPPPPHTQPTPPNISSHLIRYIRPTVITFVTRINISKLRTAHFIFALKNRWFQRKITNYIGGGGGGGG